VLFVSEFECKFSKGKRVFKRGITSCAEAVNSVSKASRGDGCAGIMGSQYQGVKAFGDKPWLMTRKSEVALIYMGPLAHPGKAVCCTKETPNLLRDMLNIPLLLGTKKIFISLYWCNSKQSAGLHPISLLVFKENQREYDVNRELWFGELVAQLNESLA